MVLRAILVWLLLLVIAIVSGGIRNSVLEPRVGEQTAHVLGTLAVVAILAGAIFLLTPWIMPLRNERSLISLGAGWVAATVAFEFVFGHLVMGHSWNRLTHDYNIFAGRLWPLVLVTVLLMPLITGVLRRNW